MKIVVIGGTGLIGSKTVERLRGRGHEVVAASPNTGVNTLTGQGLAEALSRAQVVIDLANSPTFEGEAVREFFQTSSRNLIAAARAAGVGHHVALSVVGIERLLASDYFRGKIVQEQMIRSSGLPYTIVHSTQFFEFLPSIAKAGTVGGEVHVPPARVQPIAADDVADSMTAVALGIPMNSTIEIAGPTGARLCDLVSRYMRATGDMRRVHISRHAPYFGVELESSSLMPGNSSRLGRITFDVWLARATSTMERRGAA